MAPVAAATRQVGLPLLEVRDLRITFRRDGRPPVVPVEAASFSIRSGERVALVGESGSGKSLTALAVMGLIPAVGGEVDEASSIMFDDSNLVGMREGELRRIRGGKIGMIFQDPLSTLDPVHTVGYQIIETLRLHRPDIDGGDMRGVAVDLLRQVRLARAERLVDAYPHELSGGMRQRVMIATALAGDPLMLIADEPTTALDVTVQASVLDLLYELGESRGLAVLLITHDLSIVAGFTEQVMVMYGGRIVESAATDQIYQHPKHPYTAALLQSIPTFDRAQTRLVAIPGRPPEPSARPDGCVFHPRCEFVQPICREVRPELVVLGRADVDRPHRVGCHLAASLELTMAGPRSTETPSVEHGGSTPLLEVRGLTKQFRIKAGLVRKENLMAVNDVSFDVNTGEAFGIVGESGSGKSTLARCMLRLIEPSAGSVRLDGRDLFALEGREMRRARMNMQMIFQDPASSMDPRMNVRRALSEPMKIHGRWGEHGYDKKRLVELIDLVQLPADSLDRYPHEFSGGQRQRIAIARALALGPSRCWCATNRSRRWTCRSVRRS